jgi:NhaP-type Na+/H+ or K+/H+ antiporter
MQSSGAFWGLSPRSFLASPPCDFNPDVALFLFLAPLVYSSAVELPWPEFRDHLRSIAILAIALVVVTTANQRGPLLADIHSRRNSGKNS